MLYAGAQPENMFKIQISSGVLCRSYEKTVVAVFLNSAFPLPFPKSVIFNDRRPENLKIDYFSDSPKAGFILCKWNGLRGGEGGE